MRRAFTLSSTLALVVTAVAIAGCSDAASRPDGGGIGLGGAGGGVAGSSGGGGSAAAPVVNCSDVSDPIDPTATIDDMETPDYMTVRAGGRNGAWWAGGDPSSPGATITPNGDAAAEPIPGGR